MKRKKKKIKSLSLRIIRNAMFPIFLVSVVSCVVCYIFILNNMMETISAEMDSQWENETAAQDSYLEGIGKIISDGETQRIANRYFGSIMDSTYKESSAYYKEFQDRIDSICNQGKKYISSVWAASYDKGVFLTDSKTDYSLYKLNCSAQPWYDKHAQEEDFYYVSRPYICRIPGKEEGKEVVSYVYVIRNSIKDISGYIGFNIPISEIKENLQGVDRNFAEVYLFSNYGDILYCSTEYTDSTEEEIRDIYNSEVSRKSDDTLKSYDYEDEEVVAKSYRSGTNGYFYILTVPKSVLYSRTINMMSPIFTVFVAGFAAMFFSMLFVTKSFVNPLKRLIINTKKVGDGELDMVLDIPNDDEMGQLVDVFNTTVVKMRHKAEHDPLTDVYNHEKFCQEAEKMLENEEKKVVIMRLDVDQFKTVNELFDWEVGNRLLKHIAKVLTDDAPRDCIFGRQGGDVFHVCLYYNEFEEITSLIEAFISKIREFNEINLKIYPHFGIVLCNRRDLSVHIICDHAGVALKQIKGNILETFAIYDERLEERIMSRKFVEIQKESAMINREFFVQMQPKTNMLTDKIVGAEALVRWKHPEKGIIRPDEFIPVFEKDGYILNLDEFVWEESCRYISKWMQKGIQIPVSVNVSRMHIFDESFINKLICLTEKYNIPKHLLELEFTESAMLDDVEDLYRIMEKLGGMGFPLVMDDFASGYSSLNMLKALDFDVVKLDKEFVDEVTDNNKSYQLVAATIGMLQKLNIRIVGEGIETLDQVEKLKNAGLIIAQGYYYSRPLNIDSFEEKLYKNYEIIA